MSQRIHTGRQRHEVRAWLVIPLSCCLAIAVHAPAPAWSAEKCVIPTYELYSWQSPQGTWEFCLLYTTDRLKTVKEVLHKKPTLHRVKPLKDKISSL